MRKRNFIILMLFSGLSFAQTSYNKTRCELIQQNHGQYKVIQDVHQELDKRYCLDSTDIHEQCKCVRAREDKLTLTKDQLSQYDNSLYRKINEINLGHNLESRKDIIESLFSLADKLQFFRNLSAGKPDDRTMKNVKANKIIKLGSCGETIKKKLPPKKQNSRNLERIHAQIEMSQKSSIDKSKDYLRNLAKNIDSDNDTHQAMITMAEELKGTLNAVKKNLGHRKGLVKLLGLDALNVNHTIEGLKQGKLNDSNIEYDLANMDFSVQQICSNLGDYFANAIGDKGKIELDFALRAARLDITLERNKGKVLSADDITKDEKDFNDIDKVLMIEDKLKDSFVRGDKTFSDEDYFHWQRNYCTNYNIYRYAESKNKSLRTDLDLLRNKRTELAEIKADRAKLKNEIEKNNSLIEVLRLLDSDAKYIDPRNGEEYKNAKALLKQLTKENRSSLDQIEEIDKKISKSNKEITGIVTRLRNYEKGQEMVEEKIAITGWAEKTSRGYRDGAFGFNTNAGSGSGPGIVSEYKQDEMIGGEIVQTETTPEDFLDNRTAQTNSVTNSTINTNAPNVAPQLGNTIQALPEQVSATTVPTATKRATQNTKAKNVTRIKNDNDDRDFNFEDEETATINDEIEALSAEIKNLQTQLKEEREKKDSPTASTSTSSTTTPTATNNASANTINPNTAFKTLQGNNAGNFQAAQNQDAAREQAVQNANSAQAAQAQAAQDNPAGGPTANTQAGTAAPKGSTNAAVNINSAGGSDGSSEVIKLMAEKIGNQEAIPLNEISQLIQDAENLSPAQLITKLKELAKKKGLDEEKFDEIVTVDEKGVYKLWKIDTKGEKVKFKPIQDFPAKRFLKELESQKRVTVQELNNYILNTK